MGGNKDHGRGTADVVDLRARRAADRASISIRLRAAEPWTVVEVAGDLDLQVVPLIPDLIASDCVNLVLALRRVRFMDAAGVGALLGIQRRAVRAGGCVRLAAPSSDVCRTLFLTGTDRVFHTFGSVAAATAAPPDGVRRAWLHIVDQ